MPQEPALDFVFPAWLEAELPAPKPISWLTKENDSFVIEKEDGSKLGPYSTVEDAYDDFRKQEQDSNLALHESCDSEGEVVIPGMLVLEDGRCLMSWTERDDLWLLQETYTMWLDQYKHWKANEDDFLAAYNFIENHPAFWVRLNGEKTLTWHTGAGTPNAIFPFRDNDGRVCIGLEAGAHVEPDYTTHYHDLRLDVYAPSYEEAVIALAKRVDLVFDETGAEREGVVLEKSALQKELEARVAEALESIKGA